MKRKIVITFVMLTSFLVPSAADVGIGIILGSPTGISALFGNRVAVAAAWNIDNYAHLHADVWVLNRTMVDPVNWYLGVGGVLQFNTSYDDDVRAGIRIPVGLQWYATPAIELFGELAPGMRFIPGTDFDIGGGVGIRFHF